MLDEIKKYCETNLSYLANKEKVEKLSAYDNRVKEISENILNILNGEIYPLEPDTTEYGVIIPKNND